MPLTELLIEKDPMPRRLLRINELNPDYKIGESYQGNITFTVVEMDQGGMTLNVTAFESENLKEKVEERDSRRVLNVMPSPS